MTNRIQVQLFPPQNRFRRLILCRLLSMGTFHTMPLVGFGYRREWKYKAPGTTQSDERGRPEALDRACFRCRKIFAKFLYYLTIIDFDFN